VSRPPAKDAPSRAFAASTDIGHSCFGPVHLLIGLAEEGKGARGEHAVQARPMPPALRQRVARLEGQEGAEEGRAEAPFNALELDNPSHELTRMARDGELDPVIGRVQERETTIEILAGRRKNNRSLIGEPGVGKPRSRKASRSGSWTAWCPGRCAASAGWS
jgi:ATP-dependent Clp protease ATP-binding subunit ClpC